MKKETGSLEKITRKEGRVHCEYNIQKEYPLHRVQRFHLFDDLTVIIYHDYNKIGTCC